VNCPDSIGGVPAGSAGSGASVGIQAHCCGLSFSSIHLLLRAGEVLKQVGYDVLVVPRRINGCGVLLLVERHCAAAALGELARRSIEPAEVLPYENELEVADVEAT
jgi:hypothetical protein